MIYLGADHAGFAMKEKLKAYLQKRGKQVKDLGAWKLNPTDDYPDIAIPVAELTVKTQSKGILICGSAEGVCIAANKVKGARAIAAWDAKTAKLSRSHNDANILCLAGGNTVDKNRPPTIPFAKLTSIVNVWLTTEFSGEARHKRRLDKIAEYESH